MHSVLASPDRFNARMAKFRAAKTAPNFRLFLSLLLIWDLFRASSMWFGYPSAEEEFGTVDPTAQQVMLYMMVPAIAGYVLLDFPFLLTRIKRLPPLVWLLIGGLVTAVLTSLDRTASFRGLIATAIISLPPLLCYWRTGPQNTYRTVQKFCVAAIFANFAYWILFSRYAVMTGVLAGSLRGLFIHKNFFAQFMVEALICISPTYQTLRRLDHIAAIYGLAALLDVVMLVFSHSATAVVLLVLIVVTYFALRALSRIRLRIVRVMILTGVLVFGVVVYLTLAAGLLETVTAALGKDPTLTGRTKLWEILYQISLQRPWTGAGFGVYRLPNVMAQLAPVFGWQARSTHNTYLELVLTIGYPMTILFCALIAMAMFKKLMFLRMKDEWQMRGFLVMLAIMIGASAEAGWLLATMVSWPLLLTVVQTPLTVQAKQPVQRPGPKRSPLYPMRRQFAMR